MTMPTGVDNMSELMAAHGLSAAPKLAAVFAERRRTRPADDDLVRENLAELTTAGIIGDGGTLVESTGLLRIIAGGCGHTGFAATAALAARQPDPARQTWANYGDAAVFLGLAERAYQLAVRSTTDRSARAPDPDPALLPGVQFAIARIRGGIDTMAALLSQHVHQEAELSHGAAAAAASWVARYYIATAAEPAVSAACDIVGARDLGYGEQMGRIWQDLKTGPAQPTRADFALEIIGKTTLGIDPAQTPRWL
jgi:hypothetical protein